MFAGKVLPFRDTFQHTAADGCWRTVGKAGSIAAIVARHGHTVLAAWPARETPLFLFFYFFAMTSQPLGILMLDTQFPRPVGDVGNPDSYPYPVVLRRVPRATPTRVVHERAEGLVDDFCDAARALQDTGCRAIITSCGFLALHQRRMAAAVDIPMGTSALLLIPLLRTLLGAHLSVGILTASATSLSSDHLDAVGADPATPVQGIAPDSAFARIIIGNQTDGDMAAVGNDVVAGAQALIAKAPDIGAILLECTNMGPYRERIAALCGRPVFDLIDLAHFLMQATPGIPSAFPLRR